MQRKNILVTVLCLLASSAAIAQKREIIHDYISRYRELAMEEMKRTGVPAAITLAQGIHESGAGNSQLALTSNNHFGIKCKSNWTGESVKHDDDARGECFRKYPSSEDSYKDHSDFLRNGQRYAFLFRLDPEDYKGWARGLKQAGYATNPKYPEVLIKLVEDYNLQQYTQIALGKINTPVTELATTSPVNPGPAVPGGPVPADVTGNTETTLPSYPEGEFRINETRVIFARKGTAYLAIAQQYDTDLSKLFDFNDMSPAEAVDKDRLIYLQRKRKTGLHAYHIVQPGETLHDIAQAEAIRTESLLELNWLKPHERPAPGERLSLQAKSATIPKLTLRENYPLVPATTAKGTQ